jgi:hypothetical protein
MSTTNLTAGQVMLRVAALMNDTALTQYTYVTMLPYLNMALDDLLGAMQLANVPITQEVAAYITLPVGSVKVTPAESLTLPHYPSDLIEIRGLGERLSGTTDEFIPLTKHDFLPVRSAVDSLIDWAWMNQEIRLIGALTIRELKLDYIRECVAEAADENSVIGIINSKSYLAFKAAAYCARYIGENPTRADQLDSDADKALEEMLGISIKAQQNLPARRRPFRASYKAHR